jgi:DEAD/DEAH box helicase domain-containing protein
MIGGIQEDKYAVVDVTRVDIGRAPSILEEVEVSRAMFEVYEGGVVRTDLWEPTLDADRLYQFMHQGLTFIVCFSAILIHQLSQDFPGERSQS